MKSQDWVLKRMSAIPRLVRGSVCELRNRRKDGGSYHIVQYTKGGRHHGRNVPAAQLAAYLEATENYRRFMALVDEYVDLMSERAAREIAKEAGNGRKAGR